MSDRGRIQPDLRADVCVFRWQDAEATADLTESPGEPWPKHVVVAGNRLRALQVVKDQIIQAPLHSARRQERTSRRSSRIS